MKQELDHFLTKRFPEIFKNRQDSEKDSLMYWGFECDDGWFNILYQACSLVENHIEGIKYQNKFRLQIKEKIEAGEKVHEDWTIEYKRNGLSPNEVPVFKAAQIKEKFGTLRFYHDGGDSFINGVISSAQNSSAMTCEVCGSKGKLRHGGWIRTLCDQHAQEAHNFVKEKEIEVGDSIQALTQGSMKQLTIKEIHAEYFIGKTYTSEYDHKVNDYIITDGEEIYTIKNVKTDIHSYYDATIITE